MVLIDYKAAFEGGTLEDLLQKTKRDGKFPTEDFRRTVREKKREMVQLRERIDSLRQELATLEQIEAILWRLEDGDITPDQVLTKKP